MEIKTYLMILWKRWWVVLLVTLAAGAAAVYASTIIPPKYEAQTSLRVITPLGGSLGDISYQTYYADRLMNTYAQIAASEQMMAEVKTRLSLKKLPEIAVNTVPGSEIITITVTASDPKLAAKTANTLAEMITARGQTNAETSGTSSEELDILNARKVELQNQLDLAIKDRDKLVLLNAQTTAQMGTLDQLIRGKEALYQNLQAQYQEAQVTAASTTNYYTKLSAKAASKLLGEKLPPMEAEITGLQQQYQKLATDSATYSQQIDDAGQSVQNKEDAYQNLLSQIDSARIANSKHESAQEVMIASVAIPPLKPTGLSSSLIIGLGIVCGLFVGILLAFLVNTFDTRVLSTDEIHRLTGLPIIGRMPYIRRSDRKAPWNSEDLSLQRAIQTLCTKLLTLQRANPVKTILLTSPNPREGKSIISRSLAEALAKANRTVLVVDTDWRKSGLVKMLNASPSDCNLMGFLRGDCSFEEAIQVYTNPRIHYLLNGPNDEDLNTYLHGTAFAELLKHLDAYDFVLFDSPAMLAVPDAYNIAMHVDGIILVALRKHTRMEDIREMLTQLEDVKPKILGTIINRVPLKRVSGYYYRKTSRVRDILSKYTAKPTA